MRLSLIFKGLFALSPVVPACVGILHLWSTIAEATAFVGNGLPETGSDDMLTALGVIHTLCQHPLF